jgi:hypothetical protein
VFAKLGWKSLTGTKHSSLLQTFVNYWQKGLKHWAQDISGINECSKL